MAGRDQQDSGSFWLCVVAMCALSLAVTALVSWFVHNDLLTTASHSVGGIAVVVVAMVAGRGHR